MKEHANESFNGIIGVEDGAAVWHDIEASKHVFGTAGTGYEGRGPGMHDRK
jgi:hypothetical protein